MNNYKVKAIFFTAGFAGFTALFFYNPALMNEGVRTGLEMCSGIIIPSLFPFMVVSDFLISSGVGYAVGEKFSSFTKSVFNLPGCASTVILMSLIGGFPVGAGMTSKLVEEKYLTKKQGERMLLFCVNCGPAFAVNTIGVSMLGNKKNGIIIFASLTLSALLIGIFSKFFYKSEYANSIRTVSEISVNAIVDSVRNSAFAMLSVCSWVVIFSCVGKYISLLPLREEIKTALISFCEVTNGCKNLSVLCHPVFVAGAVGWSGLCVHCQVLEHIRKCGMSYAKFILGRTANSVLSCAISFGLMKLFHCEKDVFNVISDVTVQPYSVSVSAGIAVLVLGAFLIADNDLARNERI